MYSSSSDSGDGASAFSTLEANNNPTIVETILLEGDPDNDNQWLEGQWPEGEGFAEGLADDAQVNLSTRPSGAPSETGAVYDSGLQDLVIDTNDPGRADFVISVGALGNAIGAPLDGSQNMSFGESTVDKKRAIDGNNDNEGMIVYSRSESSTSYNTPSGFDLSDPEVIADLLTRPPVADPCSPTASTIRFNEQVMVTEYTPNTMLTHGGVSSTLTGNLGGTGATSPSSSLPGSDALCQHANTGGNPNSNAGGSPNSHGSPNSDGSNGNNGNQGGTSNGNDPPGPGPSGNYLDKLMFTYTTAGGPLQHWGIEGTIRVADVVQFKGSSDPQNPHQLALHGKRLLIRPDIVDRVTDKMHFVYRHNDKNRVRAIINGMPLFVLTAPNTRMTSRNVTMLEDYVASSQEVCRILIRHLTHANTLPPDQLPVEAPLLFYAK